MVNVGTGKSGSRFIKSGWPIDEGLTAGTNKLRKKPNLEIEEKDLTTDREGL